MIQKNKKIFVLYCYYIMFNYPCGDLYKESK